MNGVLVPSGQCINNLSRFCRPILFHSRECGRSEDVNYGIALWQLLSDARDAKESLGAGTYGEVGREKAHWIPRFVRALWRRGRRRSQ